MNPPEAEESPVSAHSGATGSMAEDEDDDAMPKFQFVSHQEKGGLSKAKSHIQRHVQRERHRVRRLRETREFQAHGWALSKGPLPWRSQKLAPTPIARKPPLSTDYGSPKSNSSISTDDSDDGSGAGNRSRPGWQSSAVQQVTTRYNEEAPLPLGASLGASRKDPFSSLPVPRNVEIDFLLDHFTQNTGPHLYGYPPNRKFDMFRDRSMPLAMQDPTAFHTVMLLSAISADTLRGTNFGQRKLWHRTEAIRLITERLGDPTEAISDPTIFTVAQFTFLEKKWGTKNSYKMHSRGLEQIIMQRGGLYSLRSSPLVESIVYSLNLVTPGMISIGSPSLYSPSNVRLTEMQEHRMLCIEFIRCLEDVRELASSPLNPYGDLFFAYQRGTAMHDLLTGPLSSRLGANGFKGDHTVLVQERCRLGTLLHAHCIVLAAQHFQFTVSESESEADSPKPSTSIHDTRPPKRPAPLDHRFVQHLRQVVDSEWLWKHSSETLHYFTVQENHFTGQNRLMDAQCSWKVLRLLSVSDRLTYANYESVRRFLLDCLSQDDLDSVDVGADLDIEKIRSQISYAAAEP